MKLRLPALLLTCLLCSTVQAEEVIQSFHSDIKVSEDGSMQVTETIVVRAEGNKIKRGIYRDFPTRYKDRLGNNYVVGFDILSVRRGGRNENFHTKNLSNGVRIYIGNKGSNISRGVHSYEISYRTNRQLGFFEDHDELYWNVTGNDWAFPILNASATVQLPSSVDAKNIKLEAYTGFSGSKERNYFASIKGRAVSYFETTRPLGVKQGLTIVVGFPKGHVIEPDMSEKIGYVLKDNSGIAAMSLGLLILLAYYCLVWTRVGKDPEQGVIIAHYEPPADYSPAATRFIREMGYDKTCFTAAIVSLAVKGYLTISEEDAGSLFGTGSNYVLSKKEGSNEKISWDEQVILNKLFKTSSSLTLTQTNHSRISKLLEAHENILEKDYETKYFKTNSWFFAAGLFITALVLLFGFVNQMKNGTNEATIFLTIWLSIWSIGVCVLVANAWRAWKKATSTTSAGTVITALGSTAFVIPFVFFEFMAIGMLVNESSITFPLMLVLVIVVNWIFYELLKAPTLAGRKLMDKVDGFKRYIEVAEQHELAYNNAGGKTPELFERILPYAIALEIEDIWGTQFEEVLSQAAAGGAHYSPGWYRGSGWSSSNITGFTRTIGSSLGSAIASSSTAPGSSSGGGGGGFSGGGGGGGGGGGW